MLFQMSIIVVNEFVSFIPDSDDLIAGGREKMAEMVDKDAERPCCECIVFFPQCRQYTMLVHYFAFHTA